MKRTRKRNNEDTKRPARSAAAIRGRGVRPSVLRSPRLTLDEAFIALLIGAMDANRHVSREELARAHHIIWSMKKLSPEVREQIGRLSETMRTIVNSGMASPPGTAWKRATSEDGYGAHRRENCRS